mgnify:CR=1 FL=1
MEVMSVEDIDELLAKISGMKNYKKSKEKHFISETEIEEILEKTKKMFDINNSNKTNILNESILFDLPISNSC